MASINQALPVHVESRLREILDDDLFVHRMWQAMVVYHDSREFEKPTVKRPDEKKRLSKQYQAGRRYLQGLREEQRRFKAGVQSVGLADQAPDGGLSGAISWIEKDIARIDEQIKAISERPGSKADKSLPIFMRCAIEVFRLHGIDERNLVGLVDDTVQDYTPAHLNRPERSTIDKAKAECK